MRILLAHDAPLDSDATGSHLASLAALLQGLGHEARILLIADRPVSDSKLEVVTVVASSDNPAADLPFARPAFMPADGRSQDYGALTDSDLVRYRQVLRERLDSQIVEFNPHVIHCQHVWVFAHLILESGAPYVVTAYDAEIDALAHDRRYARFAQEAAENAGRILVASEELAIRVMDTFARPADRVTVVSPAAAGQVVSIYESVLRERGMG